MQTTLSNGPLADSIKHGCKIGLHKLPARNLHKSPVGAKLLASLASPMADRGMIARQSAKAWDQNISKVLQLCAVSKIGMQTSLDEANP